MAWDTEDEIAQMIKKNAKDQRLPPNLPVSDFEKLPEKTGVYYFYNQEKKVIYVGKAVNIKKRVASHFTGNKINAQRQHFLRDIYAISFEVCGNELMALLMECNEIKKLWPIYNRALKKFEPKFGLYEYEAINGYRYLTVTKINKFQTPIEVFNSLNEGFSEVQNLTKQFDIDFRFCKITSPNNGELFNHINSLPLPDRTEHNFKIDEALNHWLTKRPTFAIIDKGRTFEEYSCVWVEKGHFYGMGYIEKSETIFELSDLKNFLTPYKSNNYTSQLISNYALKYPKKVNQIS